MNWFVSIAAFLVLGLSSAFAQSFPTSPVKVVVPVPAGGTADTLSRAIAPYLSNFLGQAVVIENRPGAAGVVAAAHVQRSTPDGYTIGLISSAVVSAPAEPGGTNFDVTQVQAVAFLGRVPGLLCAKPSLPVESLADVIALARAKPGQLTYGHPGPYSASQLAIEAFKQRANVDIRGIPYKGAAPAFQDLLGGQIDLAIAGSNNCKPFIASKQLRPIATTGSQRLPALPDVKTFAENGLPGFELDEWWGIVVPLNTPSDIVARLHKEITRAIQEPKVRDFFALAGTDPQDMSVEEFSAFLLQQKEKFKALVDSMNLAK